MKLLSSIIILAISINSMLANNGKIAYASLIENFMLDGSLNDWTDINSNPIDTYLGDHNSPHQDCTAKFKAGFQKNKIYLAVEIEDDQSMTQIDKDWFSSDALVIYLNFCQANEDSGVARVILNQEKITIEKHDKTEDLCNYFLTDTRIIHKYKQNKNKAIYEIVIETENEIMPLNTIGIDFHVIDVDKDEKSELEIIWGPPSFHKFYMPGYLGDLVFVEDHKKLTTVSGQVTWNAEENFQLALPQSIDIKSKTKKEFKVCTMLDTLGQFSLQLPVGDYYLHATDNNTSLFEKSGTDNHRKINRTEKIEFNVLGNTEVKTKTLQLKTSSPPEYLYKSNGIIHNFTKDHEIVIDNFITKYSSYYNIPAVSLAIIKNNQIIYSNDYGLSNPINNAPIKENSVFQIASMTKSVFAYIVLRLAEKGLIDLDKPLCKYLPFKQIEHNEGYEKITARIILSHQSGLPNWAWGGTGGWKNGEKLDLSFIPGTAYQYSGEGYEYLGRVVEHITSKSLETHLEEEIKQPLGIEKIYFKPNLAVEQIKGHYGNHTTLWDNYNTAGPAHSIRSDANTFAQFVCELGKQENLSKESFTQLLTPTHISSTNEEMDNSTSNQRSGLGFMIEDTEFGKAVMHGGDNGDFYGEYKYFTEAKLGYVVFTNSNRGHKLVQAVDQFLIYGTSKK